MRVLVLLLIAMAMAVWSWWTTRWFFDTASRPHSRLIALVMLLGFIGIIFLPIAVVGATVQWTLGPVSPRTQLIALLLGPLPTLVFIARNARRWKRPNDRESPSS